MALSITDFPIDPDNYPGSIAEPINVSVTQPSGTCNRLKFGMHLDPATLEVDSNGRLTTTFGSPCLDIAEARTGELVNSIPISQVAGALTTEWPTATVSVSNPASQGASMKVYVQWAMGPCQSLLADGGNHRTGMTVRVDGAQVRTLTYQHQITGAAIVINEGFLLFYDTFTLDPGDSQTYGVSPYGGGGTAPSANAGSFTNVLFGWNVRAMAWAMEDC